VPVFLDAAYQILKGMDQPMSAEEITQQAHDRGLLVTRGKTPAATMSASLYMDIKEKRSTSRFIQVGPNRFSVNEEYLPQLELDAKTKIKSKRSQLSQAASAHKLLDKEMALIKAYLSGQNPHPPTSEKLCDWVTMCYTFGLFSEGVDLFSFIDPLEVNEWYYARSKKIVRLCKLHQENQSEEAGRSGA
jgi:hypothetical protein